MQSELGPSHPGLWLYPHSSGTLARERIPAQADLEGTALSLLGVLACAPLGREQNHFHAQALHLTASPDKGPWPAVGLHKPSVRATGLQFCKALGCSQAQSGASIPWTALK